MSDYKAVRSTMEISKSIADILEKTNPQTYNSMNRAQTIRAVNDTLQGRGEKSLKDMLAQLKEMENPPSGAILRDIQDFQAQKALLKEPYRRFSSRKYGFQIYDRNALHPLKIIDQWLYDLAAKQGFPPGFFREAYFDHVTFYCLPDSADFYLSELHGCTFAVCRMSSANFNSTHIYNSEFHSCELRNVSFFNANIAHSHFYDCALFQTSFVRTHLIRCNTIDCTMEHSDFLNAVLDGCTYGRVKATETRELRTAFITQGGATTEECRQNRVAIAKALGVPDGPEPPKAPARPVKRKRRSNPER